MLIYKNMNEEKSFYQIFKTNLITIIVLAGTILISFNTLSTANKLAPLQQDIAVVKQAVAQIKEDSQDNVSQKELDVEITNLDTRLTRIENKVDILIAK